MANPQVDELANELLDEIANAPARKRYPRDIPRSLAEVVIYRGKRIRALEAERDALREALKNMLYFAVPGMNWSDEIGAQLIADARKALAGGEGSSE